MGKQGQYNYKGVNAQAWAAMSLFLQYLHYSDFSHIQLEAPQFEDFNLVFSDGHKIICESKDWKKEFSFSDLKKILSNILKKTAIGEKDEILIICTELNDGLRSKVENMRYWSKFITPEFKKKKFSEQQISVLDKVRFWKVQEKDNHLIVYALFSELLEYWLPEDELECKSDSILIKRIYAGSAKGGSYSREDIVGEIKSMREKASQYSGYFDDERVKTEVQLQNLIKAVDDNKSPEWAPHQLSALTSKPALMFFALDRIKGKKIDNLQDWSDLWGLYKIYRFSFSLFRIFENNLHTEKNKKYILKFFKNNIGEIRRFYQRGTFDVEIVKITEKILDTEKKSEFIKDAFEIIKILVTEGVDNIFYLKLQNDNSWEQEEIAKLLKKIYKKSNPALKEKVYKLLVGTFNFVEDDGEFSHYTSRENFEVIRCWLESDFKNRLIVLTKVLSKQYSQFYKKFGGKISFNGWEHMGGMTTSSGHHYTVNDRHFISFVLEPAIKKYYSDSKDKKRAWNFIVQNCISKADNNDKKSIIGEVVNKNRPDFLNRAALAIILRRYQDDDKSISDEAFDILKEFILSRKGIPLKSDLIYQALRDDHLFLDDKKWRLVEISLNEYGGIPMSVFIEEIVADLARKGHSDAKETMLSWVRNPKYYLRSRFEINVVQNIRSVLESDFDYALDLFEEFINSEYFIDKQDSFDSYDVAALLYDILRKDHKRGFAIIERVSKQKILTRNQQIILCFSLFSRGNDQSDDIKLLEDVYEGFVDPFLNELDNDIDKIVNKLPFNQAREAFIQFADRLVRNKKIEEALRIVKVFLNDPDPYPGPAGDIDPDDPEEKYNEHKRIENGEKSQAIVSVRGWCAWVVSGCNVLDGRIYVDDIIRLTKILIEDRNYYVKQMGCMALSHLMKIRLTVLPSNKDILFLDPSLRKIGKTEGEDLVNSLKKSKEIEKIAFDVLEDISNKSDNVKKALMPHIVNIWNYLRTLNQKEAEIFCKLVCKFPDDAIAEMVPLLLYFSEVRERNFKDWKWQANGYYDDLGVYDSRWFKAELKKLLNKRNNSINDKLAWHLKYLVKEHYNIKSSDIDYAEDFDMAYGYIDKIADDYSHDSFSKIYMFIEENLEKKEEECSNLLIKCYEVEKKALETLVGMGKAQEVYWWPFYHNGTILGKLKDRKKFLEAFRILLEYPKEVSIGDVSEAISVLMTFNKDDAKANTSLESYFDILIARDINYIGVKRQWEEKNGKK